MSRSFSRAPALALCLGALLALSACERAVPPPPPAPEAPAAPAPASAASGARAADTDAARSSWSTMPRRSSRAPNSV